MNSKIFAALTATGVLVALPATGVADPGKGQAKSQSKSQKAKSCKKTQKVGFSVAGTLVSIAPDGAVTLTVTRANSHAEKSGELTDQDASTKGVQAEGGTYTVPAADAHDTKLVDFEGTDTPSAGDEVKVSGKVARTKSRCAPAGTSEADRYATPDVRRVTIADRDPDA